jgi:gas vesicle protein
MGWIIFLLGIWVGIIIGFFMALFLRDLPDDY